MKLLNRLQDLSNVGSAGMQEHVNRVVDKLWPEIVSTLELRASFGYTSCTYELYLETDIHRDFVAVVQLAICARLHEEGLRASPTDDNEMIWVSWV